MENLTQEELKLFFQNASYDEKKQAYPKLMKRALENPKDEITLNFLYQLSSGIFIDNLSTLLTLTTEEHINNLQNFFKTNLGYPALLSNIYIIYKNLDETQKEMKAFLLEEIKNVTVIKAEDYSILKIYFDFKKDSDEYLNRFAEGCLNAVVFKEIGLASTLSEMAKEKESISDILDFCDKAIWKDAIIPCKALSKIEKQVLPPDNASDKRIKEFLELKEILEGMSLKIIEKDPILDLDNIKNLFDMTWRMKALFTQCKKHDVENGTINTIKRILFDVRNDCDLKAFYDLLEIIYQKSPIEAKSIPSLVNQEIEKHDELKENKSSEAHDIIALCLSILAQKDYKLDDSRCYNIFKKAITNKARNPLERLNLRSFLEKYTMSKGVIRYVLQSDKKVSYPKENIKDFIDFWWLNQLGNKDIDDFKNLLKIMQENKISESFFENDRNFEAWKKKLKKVEDEASREQEELQNIRQKIDSLPK